MNIEEQFVPYENNLGHHGVIMPQIKIDDKYYQQYSIDKNVDNAEFLRAISKKGMAVRGLSGKVYEDRLDYELKMFDELKYVDYIISVWDICNFAHEKKIPMGYGRGSAAGSLVLYCLKVTDVEPLKHDLFFERFVSKSRAKNEIIDGVCYFDGSLLCDVDLDFDYRFRGQIIDYINNKYEGQTAHILTMNTLSGKLVVKECMKIVGEFSEEEANFISNLLPKVYGSVKPLDEARAEVKKFDSFCSKNEKVYSIARKLENLNKNFGVHPSGIAITAKKIRSVMPIQKTKEGAFITGIDMNWAAEFGVKFDILGLRTLSVVDVACKMSNLKKEDVDLDDPRIYAALQVLDHPKGIFQIEADSQYAACKKVRPDNMSELADLMSLARPGAMDYIDDYVSAKINGPESNGHPVIDEILNKTKGIPLAQETMMQLGNRVFGLSLDEAETLRRIIGKKKTEEMPVWKEKVYNNCEELDLEKKFADFYWKILDDSKNYSFNFSHAFSYGYLSALTVYLKFVYPKEFFCALLRMTAFEQEPQNEISTIQKELAAFDIKLLPPDLLKSDSDFTIEGKNIRYGLSSIKGLNQKTMDSIVALKDAPRSNKYELFKSAVENGVNLGALCALIQSGALDSCSTNRPRTVLEAQTFKILTPREQRIMIETGAQYEYNLLEHVAAMKNKVATDGKVFLKDSRWNTFVNKFNPYKELYSENKKHSDLAVWWFETNLLGYSYSKKLKDCFTGYKNKDIKTSSAQPKGENVSLVGMVKESITTKSKKGNRYLRLRLSDETGEIDCLLLNSNGKNKLDDFLKTKDVPKKNSIVHIKGSYSGDGTVFADKIEEIQTKIYLKISELK